MEVVRLLLQLVLEIGDLGGQGVDDWLGGRRLLAGGLGGSLVLEGA